MSDKTNNARRRFLRAGATTAGALMLGSKVNAHEGHDQVASATTSSVTTTTVTTVPAATIVPVAPAEISLTLRENAALAKIGGSIVIENGDDKVIVMRTTANDFAACSAICTHKGCIVDYDHSAKQLVCPCHGARFDLAGKILQGPAKKPLRAYPTDTAAVVSLAAAPNTTAPSTEKKTS